MEQRIITKESTDIAVFDQLFTEAFPPEERLLPSTLAEFEGIVLNGFYENNNPVGMMVTVNFQGFVYILFLATFAQYRGQGIGSKVLNALYENNPDTFTMGVIEKPEESAANNAQRLARQKFYERLGYKIYDFSLNFHNTDFLTIAKGSDADNKEVVERHWHTMMTIAAQLKGAFEE